MKKSKIVTTYIPKINYENESLTVTQDCWNNLVYFHLLDNDKIENLALLEKSLLSYSILKLLNWDKKEFNMNCLTSLENICELINSYIPTEEERNSYFVQYVHCIIYIIGVINKQSEQINWEVKENVNDEIEIYDNDNVIVKIITDKNIPSYQLPNKLIDKLNNYLKPKEKNPVLKK